MKLELSGNAQKTSMKSEFAPHVAQTPSNTTTQSSSEGIKVRSVQRCSFVFCFFLDVKCSAAAPPFTASEAVVSDLRISLCPDE